MDVEKISQIANYSKDRIGENEESVKINFIVPLLEALDHNRLDYEYKFKDIVLKKGLPGVSKVIVETKSYDKDLLLELKTQLERYCHEERPLLVIIANGKEIRIYSYFWRYRNSFEKSLIFHIHRSDLKEEGVINILGNTCRDKSKILSRILCGCLQFYAGISLSRSHSL